MLNDIEGIDDPPPPSPKQKFKKLARKSVAQNRRSKGVDSATSTVSLGRKSEEKAAESAHAMTMISPELSSAVAVEKEVAAPKPKKVPKGTPNDLSFLLETDKIVVEHQVEMMEVLSGLNTNKRYRLLDSEDHLFDRGRRMYIATEESDGCDIPCFRPNRSWTINVLNSAGKVGNCGGGCCGACGNNVTVATASGDPIGGVIQNLELVSASWNITDAVGNRLLRLKAPPGTVCCLGCAGCCEVAFPLLDKKGLHIGAITRFFGKVRRGTVTALAANSFGVTFPITLDVKLKATLIFASFMIDFMYYEHDPGSSDRQNQNYY